MKRLTLSFLMVIGTIILVTSQNIYPKKILLENDTVLAITKPQLITINRSLNNYVHLKKINETLQMDLVISDSIGFYWKNIALKKDEIILIEETKFLESTKYSDGLKESLKIQKEKSRKTIIGVGVGGTLLGIILGVLLK